MNSLNLPQCGRCVICVGKPEYITEEEEGAKKNSLSSQGETVCSPVWATNYNGRTRELEHKIILPLFVFKIDTRIFQRALEL